MSREGKLAKNTAILAIGTFLPKLASFITLPVLTGFLSQEEYGTYDLIGVLVSLVLPTATLQIQTAAFRYLIDVRNDEDKVKKIISNIFAFIILTSLIALIILYFCLPGNFVSVKLWICAYFFADILVNGARQITRGLANNVNYSVSAIISAMGKMFFVVIFVWRLRWGLQGAVMSLCAASTFSLLFLTVKMKLFSFIEVGVINKETLKELLNYSWPMVPNSMSMWVMRVSDRFVVTWFMGISANAIYSVANKIPSLLTLAQSTFTMAWQENASIVSKDEDADVYYTSMFRTMYDLMAGFFGLLIAVTPILFAILIRGDYDEAYSQIPVLFLGMFFYSMSSFLGGIYVAYKATRDVGLTTMAAAACNFITDIVAIKYIGLYAASGSTLISYLLLFVFRMIDVCRLVKLTYDVKHIIAVFVMMIIECVLCFLQKSVLNAVNLVLSAVMFFVLNKVFIRAIWKKSMDLLNRAKKQVKNR